MTHLSALITPLIRPISNIKRPFFSLVPHRAAAEYFILEAEIECLLPFTRSAFCLRCEELGGQNEIPGQRCLSQTAWRQQVETREMFLFFSRRLLWDSVTLRWRSRSAAEGRFVLENEDAQFSPELQLELRLLFVCCCTSAANST